MVDRVNSGAYREQRVPSILQEDTVGEQTEHDQPVSHIRQIHHEATKSPSIQSTETSSSHEKPKTKITSKVRSAILSTAKKLTRGRSGSSGSGGSRRSTQEIHIVSQADAHPGDPDNIENRLQETLVLDVPPPVELHRSRELEETHSSSSTGLILQTEVSATVHVHRQSDQIHLEHHQGVDHLHGVELRREHEHYDPYKDSDEMYEQYSAPKGVLGTGQGASVSFRKDEEFEQYSAQKTIIGVGASPTSGGIGHGASITVGKSEVFEQHSGQKNIIGMPPIPTEAIEPYSPMPDVVLKKVGEQKSAHYNAYGADAEIAAASQRHLISRNHSSTNPDMQFPKGHYHRPRCPAHREEVDLRGTTTSASSRSRTPTDYEVADYMMETARLDDARIEHRAVDDTPRITPCCREHELRTKLHCDDDLSEKAQKITARGREIRLAQPKERAVDVQHRRFGSVFQRLVHGFCAGGDVEEGFNLDGAPIELCRDHYIDGEPLGCVRTSESHLETHDEHAEYDEVTVERVQQQKVFGHSQLSGTYTSTVETHLGEENIYEELITIKSSRQTELHDLPEDVCSPSPSPTSAPPPRDVHRAREEFAHRHDSSAERKFKVRQQVRRRTSPEPTEDEHLDWELIYTTNAIRQMSRNNKWRESMLNKDKIPPVPKKTKELPADVLPKNSPFTRPAESPSSGRKTPTSWTKNEGFTFSMEEERSKRAAPEAWEHERVGVKQVPTNIARGHQITVPRVAQPKEVVEPQPVDRQPTHQAPVAPRRATTEESYHFQGVKNLRQQFCSPEAAPWRRTQSVGNVYEVPRARLEHGDDLRTRPGPLRHIRTRRGSSGRRSPRRFLGFRSRPRPVDLSPLTADAQQRFYTLRSPSPRAQTTPSPLARSEAELRIGGGAQPGQHFHSKPPESDQHEVRHQEHHLEKENHYEEIEHGEVITKPGSAAPKTGGAHHDEPAKENGHHPHGPDYSPYPHHFTNTHL
ncbi:unnamed protein product, partial [Mesorhabditis spiculigera]